MSEILNPHDDDLESVILGACLTETTAMVLVGDKLSPEMFYETKFGEIYSALLSMYHSGKAIDLVTVRAELASRGKLELVEYRLPDFPWLSGITLAELYKKIKTKFLVCAVQRDGDVMIPGGDFVMQSGDRIHVADRKSTRLNSSHPSSSRMPSSA